MARVCAQDGSTALAEAIAREKRTDEPHLEVVKALLKAGAVLRLPSNVSQLPCVHVLARVCARACTRACVQ